MGGTEFWDFSWNYLAGDTRWIPPAPTAPPQTAEWGTSVPGTPCHIKPHPAHRPVLTGAWEHCPTNLCYRAEKRSPQLGPPVQAWPRASSDWASDTASWPATHTTLHTGCTGATAGQLPQRTRGVWAITQTLLSPLSQEAGAPSGPITGNDYTSQCWEEAR